MATMERRIRHTTMGAAMPESTWKGIDSTGPCAVVREGNKLAVIPYTTEMVDTSGTAESDQMLDGVADWAFETLAA